MSRTYIQSKIKVIPTQKNKIPMCIRNWLKLNLILTLLHLANLTP